MRRKKMKSMLKLTVTCLLVFAITFSVSVLTVREAQAARNDYTCCKIIIRIKGHVIKSYGVWIDGRCLCSASPEQNPNGCELFCNPT
jgi:hypothetical protein